MGDTVKSTNDSKSTKIKSTYFVPQFLVSVEAESIEEAYKVAKAQSQSAEKGQDK